MSVCSATCGLTGTQSQMYVVTVPQAGTGAACPSTNGQLITQTCNTAITCPGKRNPNPQHRSLIFPVCAPVCLNGGYCSGTTAAPFCQCTPCYTGTQCQTSFLTCASNPCANGGTCVEGTCGYNCTCPMVGAIYVGAQKVSYYLSNRRVTRASLVRT
jgi:hypothetical protein